MLKEHNARASTSGRHSNCLGSGVGGRGPEGGVWGLGFGVTVGVGGGARAWVSTNVDHRRPRDRSERLKNVAPNDRHCLGWRASKVVARAL